MITKPQERTMTWLEMGLGYEFQSTMMPLGRGALLLTLKGKLIDSFELTVNTDGSYHTAFVDEEMAA